MKAEDVKVGMFVRPNTSAKKGEVGTIVEYAGGKRVLAVAVKFDDGEWDFKPEELELVEDSTTSISYNDAVFKLSIAVDALKELNLFHMSSILAVLFEKEKEQTMDDLLEYRGVRK